MNVAIGVLVAFVLSYIYIKRSGRFSDQHVKVFGVVCLIVIGYLFITDSLYILKPAATVAPNSKLLAFTSQDSSYVMNSGYPQVVACEGYTTSKKLIDSYMPMIVITAGSQGKAIMPYTAIFGYPGLIFLEGTMMNKQVYMSKTPSSLANSLISRSIAAPSVDGEYYLGILCTLSKTSGGSTVDAVYLSLQPITVKTATSPVTPTNPNAVSGLCPLASAGSSAINTCSKGTLSDIADKDTYYLWDCVGISGGTTMHCGYPKTSAPYCGDGKCLTNNGVQETSSNCAQDCPVIDPCKGGVCSASCPQYCTLCNDGVCKAGCPENCGDNTCPTGSTRCPDGNCKASCSDVTPTGYYCYAYNAATGEHGSFCSISTTSNMVGNRCFSTSSDCQLSLNSLGGVTPTTQYAACGNDKNTCKVGTSTSSKIINNDEGKITWSCLGVTTTMASVECSSDKEAFDFSILLIVFVVLIVIMIAIFAMRE